MLENEQKGQREPHRRALGTHLPTTWGRAPAQARQEIGPCAGTAPPDTVQGRPAGVAAGPWTAAPRCGGPARTSSLWEAPDPVTWGHGAGWAAVSLQSRDTVPTKPAVCAQGPHLSLRGHLSCPQTAPPVPPPRGSLWVGKRNVSRPRGDTGLVGGRTQVLTAEARPPPRLQN